MEPADVGDAETAPFTGDRLRCGNQQTTCCLEGVKHPEHSETETRLLSSDLVC